MHYVQFIWLVTPISFPLNVQIGCIFYGFKSQVEFYSFHNLKIHFDCKYIKCMYHIYIYLQMCTNIVSHFLRLSLCGMEMFVWRYHIGFLLLDLCVYVGLQLVGMGLWKGGAHTWPLHLYTWWAGKQKCGHFTGICIGARHQIFLWYQGSQQF
jgi:hypothetical protein